MKENALTCYLQSQELHSEDNTSSIIIIQGQEKSCWRASLVYIFMMHNENKTTLPTRKIFRGIISSSSHSQEFRGQIDKQKMGVRNKLKSKLS